MDICDIDKSDDVKYFRSIVYIILLIEYSILLIVILFMLRNSYKNSLYNMSEYRNYLYLILISSILKIILFADSCLSFNLATLILVVAYELPYISSETLVIYLWRVMQLDATQKISGEDTLKRQNIEFWAIIGFNVLLYIFLISMIIVLFTDYSGDIWFFARGFKATIEFLVCSVIILSGTKLMYTIKKLMHEVPKNLLFWVIVGSASSLLKGIEQVIFYYSDKKKQENVGIDALTLISYQLDDLFPTLVFLSSFSVYSKFMRQNRDSITSFEQMITDKLKSIEYE